jgi:hypothetical protein
MAKKRRTLGRTATASSSTSAGQSKRLGNTALCMLLGCTTYITSRMALSSSSSCVVPTFHPLACAAA